MINADFRTYDYYTYTDNSGYGQPQLSKEATGSIKIAINSISTSITDNVRYKDATYLGLTHQSINDSCVIQYGEERLKVLYVVPKGRMKQVFMKNI